MVEVRQGAGGEETRRGEEKRGEEEEDEKREEKEEDEDEEEATDIKSNNPHLAGGEKTTRCYQRSPGALLGSSATSVNRSTLVEIPLHHLQDAQDLFHKQPRW